MLIISVAIAIEPLPEIGLKKARGIISLGNFNKLITGEQNEIMASNIPDVLKHPMATKSPIKVGNIFTTIEIPSFAPSKKESNTFFFSYNQKIRITKIVTGIAQLEI